MSDEEYEATEPSSEEVRSGRGRKRRRLNEVSTGRRQSGSESVTSPLNGSQSETSSQEDKEKEKDQEEKPRSKYRIHIPKNQYLPRDTFFTQPPSRSPSPYRIGEFRWIKPHLEEADPSPRPRPEARVRNAGAVVVKQPAISNGVAAQTPGLTTASINVSDDDEFPDDALDALELNALPQTVWIDSQTPDPECQVPAQKLQAPRSNLRQKTLFGTQAPSDASQKQNRKHNWPLANREEPPTHHTLDHDALQTWIYPTNLGSIRDYQFSIVSRGLYHNMLVALPTGLGKTFIAATIMLNWFRWTPHAQIVFVAPTKPLVSQQVKACFEIAGVPRSATTMLTGATTPGIRADEWQEKRVFFMTPQTLINDLTSGICDPKRLVLIVIDEAHRATGGYAYVEVVKFVRRFNQSFRVLALTATPGSSVETVQEVIDGLGISRVEIRTEESLDIRQYVHQRNVETVLFDYSEEITMIMELFAKALQPLLDKLTGLNAYWSRDPMALTPYGCTLARKKWMASDAGKSGNWGLKSMVNTLFSILASLSHGVELLKFHGVGPFFRKVRAFREEGTQSKYAKEVKDSQHFQTMMSRVQGWINDKDFVGHPKLEYVQEVVVNHFLDAGEGRGASDPSGTRIIVFSHYRDSAEQIVRVLERHGPMIRPHVFVGQANSGASEGMGQKAQNEIMNAFKLGKYNTLVATSIGEEGLDIGEVDLIICYDASASPIRMLQRMGRTGRKRAGNIVVTLMRGKEENNFTKAKDNYEKIQAEITSGARFHFHDDESRRIVPKAIQPVVDKRVVDIPIENTQTDLPEPMKKTGRPKKRPPKKFHMPDGVRTGFTKASNMDALSSDEEEDLGRDETPVTVPPLSDVLLKPEEERIFESKYLDIGGDEPQVVEFPRLDAHSALQTVQRPTKQVQHSGRALGLVKMLEAMRSVKASHSERHKVHGDEEDHPSRAREPTVSDPSHEGAHDTTSQRDDVRPRASRVIEDSEDEL